MVYLYVHLCRLSNLRGMRINPWSLPLLQFHQCLRAQCKSSHSPSYSPYFDTFKLSTCDQSKQRLRQLLLGPVQQIFIVYSGDQDEWADYGEYTSIG